MRRVSSGLLALVAMASLCAQGEVTVSQQVPVSCPSASDERRAHDLEIKLPDEIAVRIGYRLAATPISAKVGTEVFGATSDVSITVITSVAVLAIGTVESKVKARLISSDLTLCDPKTLIEATFDIKDRRTDRLRVQFVPGPNSLTVLEQQALSQARSDIREAYKVSLEYLFGQGQQWLKDFLIAVEDESTRTKFATQFCDGCSWVYQQRLALGLARFIESYPEIMSPGTPNVPNVSMTAIKPVSLMCGGIPPSLGSFSWLDEGVLRVALDTVSNSYVQLRNTRAMAADALSIERVVIGGKIVAEQCD